MEVDFKRKIFDIEVEHEDCVTQQTTYEGQ
jgi:hypothetical protein